MNDCLLASHNSEFDCRSLCSKMDNDYTLFWMSDFTKYSRKCGKIPNDSYHYTGVWIGESEADFIQCEVIITERTVQVYGQRTKDSLKPIIEQFLKWIDKGFIVAEVKNVR